MLRYRRLAPVDAWLRDVATFPLRGEGWHAWIDGVVVFGVMRVMWLPGALLANTFLVAYLFHVVRTSRRGASEAPGFGENVRHVSEELPRLFAFIGALLVAAFPVAAYLGVRAVLELLGAPAADGWLEPQVWPLLAIGLVWAPIAAVFIAVDTPFLVAANPGLGWRAARAGGADAVRTAIGFWLPAALWWLLGSVGSELFPIPMVGVVLLEPVRLALAMMAARALGLYARAYLGRAGWGRAIEDADPVLGATEPREQVVPERYKPEKTTAPVEPFELDERAVPAPEQGFQPWQPPGGFDEGATSIADPSTPFAAAVPHGTAKPPLDGPDLMSEEEFEASVFGTKPGGGT